MHRGGLEDIYELTGEMLNICGACRSTNLGQWVIYDAISNVPDRAETKAELTVLFASPPSYLFASPQSYEEFCKAITHGKNASAPGMSGLSYNIIKS